MIDGVELAILSTELPSRLVVYHTVLQGDDDDDEDNNVVVSHIEHDYDCMHMPIDEQVHSALQLISGEGSSGITTGSEVAVVAGGEIAKVTYDSLLQARISTADATQN